MKRSEDSPTTGLLGATNSGGAAYAALESTEVSVSINSAPLPEKLKQLLTCVYDEREGAIDFKVYSHFLNAEEALFNRLLGASVAFHFTHEGRAFVDAHFATWAVASLSDLRDQSYLMRQGCYMQWWHVLDLCLSMPGSKLNITFNYYVDAIKEANSKAAAGSKIRQQAYYLFVYYVSYSVMTHLSAAKTPQDKMHRDELLKKIRQEYEFDCEFSLRPSFVCQHFFLFSWHYLSPLLMLFFLGMTVLSTYIDATYQSDFIRSRWPNLVYFLVAVIGVPVVTFFIKTHARHLLRQKVKALACNRMQDPETRRDASLLESPQEAQPATAGTPSAREAKRKKRRSGLTVITVIREGRSDSPHIAGQRLLDTPRTPPGQSAEAKFGDDDVARGNAAYKAAKQENGFTAHRACMTQTSMRRLSVDTSDHSTSSRSNSNSPANSVSRLREFTQRTPAASEGSSVGSRGGQSSAVGTVVTVALTEGRGAGVHDSVVEPEVRPDGRLSTRAQEYGRTPARGAGTLAIALKFWQKPAQVRHENKTGRNLKRCCC